MIELACPESCPYLSEARAVAARRETALRMKEASGAAARNLMLSERALIAVDRIERAIVDVQRGVKSIPYRDLADAEILEAVENTIKNAETEESGLIYQHPAATPRIEEAGRRIRDALDEMSKEVPPESRPRRTDIIKGLEFTRDAVRAHIKRGGGEDPRSYIRYVSLFYAWPEEATRPLIV